MRPLVWFRSDLRVGDQTALRAACADATRGVVAVFVACPGQWRRHDWGAMKTDFVLRQVETLADDLDKLNIGLIVRRCDVFADVPALLTSLARAHGCDALFFNREYEVNELRRDEAVVEAFEQAGLSVRAFDDQLILGPDRVRTNDGGFYSVYTPFRRKWEQLYGQVDDHEVGGRPSRQAECVVETDVAPISDLRSESQGHTRADLWPAGEQEARRRLTAFIEQRGRDYADQRDFPAIDGTSALSPYLAAGVISPRECFEAAREANHGRVQGGAKGLHTWLGELIWREFYRHVLIGYPRVCMGRAFRAETETLEWSDDEEAFDAWRGGRTGVPIVDAGMRQLAQTGWMHNRVRMITAMFLTKDLWLDWRWGERHFMQCLVDGDFASNNGGWQWSASTGTDAAPYFRIFNPFTQGKRFDPEGEYIRRFVPELADLPASVIHAPHAANDIDLGDYPPPIVDHSEARERAIAAFKAL